MIFLWLTPLYIAVNVFYIYETVKWINAITFIPKRISRVLKVISVVGGGFSSLAVYIAFLIPYSVDADTQPVLFAARRILKLIGNYHLAVFFYLGMSFMIILICRMIETVVKKKRGKSGDDIRNNFFNVRRSILGLLNIAFVIAVTLYGVYCAGDIKVTPYSVELPAFSSEDMLSESEAPQYDELRIVLIADLHMGYNIGCSQISRMVSLVNEQNADIVVLAGDIYDNEFCALEDPKKLCELLGSMKSTYGTYAVYGNHDVEEKIIGGFTFDWDAPKAASDKMDELLEAAGIHLLRDSGEVVDNRFYIYGRPDYERPGRLDGDADEMSAGEENGAEDVKNSGEDKSQTVSYAKRKTPRELSYIFDEVTKPSDIPIFVADHEPRELDELSQAGADLDLCGHTHDGQFFPMNLISRYIKWENSAGLLKKGDMINIVTSGVGLYGPNIRVGTDAELCVIDVRWKQK